MRNSVDRMDARRSTWQHHKHKGIGIARLLIDKGARVDALEEGSSPYDVAVACHNTETARMLSEIPAPQPTFPRSPSFGRIRCFKRV